MDSAKRSMAKACTWQTLGIVSNIALCSLFGLPLAASLELALVSSALAFVMFTLHERLWQKIRWGARLGQG